MKPTGSMSKRISSAGLTVATSFIICRNVGRGFGGGWSAGTSADDSEEGGEGNKRERREAGVGGGCEN